MPQQNRESFHSCITHMLPTAAQASRKMLVAVEVVVQLAKYAYQPQWAIGQ